MICFYQNNLTTKWVDITHYPARTPSSLPTAVYWFQLKFFPKPWQLITAWWVWLKYRNYNLTIWAEISLSTPFLPPPGGDIRKPIIHISAASRHKAAGRYGMFYLVKELFWSPERGEIEKRQKRKTTCQPEARRSSTRATILDKARSVPPF